MDGYSRASLNDMRYVTVYKHGERYGGPEDGGWYYPTIEAQSIYAHHCPDEDYTNVWDDFVETLRKTFGRPYIESREFLDRDLQPKILSGATECLFNLNIFGEGYAVCIELLPASLHDTTSYYEEYRSYHPEPSTFSY